MAVVLFRRFAIFENDARGNGESALYVGVVETFDVARELREAEVGFEALEESFGAKFGVDLFEVFKEVDFGLPSILSRDIEKFGTVAALRDSERNAEEIDVGEHGNDDLVEHGAELSRHFRDSVGEDFGDRFVKAACEAKSNATDNGTATEVHIVDEDITVVVVDAKDVDIVEHLGNDDAFGAVAFDEEVFFF